MNLIIYSNQDIAGKNIIKFLNKNLTIFGIEEEILNLKNLPFNEIDLIIVASRHKSESAIPTFCVHSPGNFSDAKHGGDEKTLSIAPALYIKEAIIEFKKQKISQYDITLEATHHGPTLNFPIMFVEIGSSEKQWNDLNACKIVSNVIKKIYNKNLNKSITKVAIGIGGNHYADKFTKILLNENIAFGHIMPKYNFNEEMIEEMVLKTIPMPEFALIDWNGLNSEQRNKAIKKLEEINLEWRKV